MHTGRPTSMRRIASRRRVAAVAAAVVSLGAACDGQGGRAARSITVTDLTGLAGERAVRLVDSLDLDIRIEEAGDRDAPRGGSSPGVDFTGGFAPGVVVRQDPAPGTKVEPGAVLTLFVSGATRLGEGERRFRLLTHCGLGLPLEFQGEHWLPVNRKLRRTINAPEGFTSHGYYDVGTVRRIDRDSLVYTSSMGIAVEYEPTSRRSQGCE